MTSDAPRPAPAAEVLRVDIVGDPGRRAAVRRLLAAGLRSEALDALVSLAVEFLDAGRCELVLLTDERVVVASAGSTAPLTRSVEGSLAAVTLRRGEPLVVPDLRAIGDGPALPVVPDGVRAYAGVPLYCAGVAAGVLCVYDDHPREWTQAQVSALTALARSAVAAVELRAVSADLAASGTRLDVALGAASIGSFELDPRTGSLTWDKRLIELFGYDSQTFTPHLDSFTDRLHPEDRRRVSAAIARAVETHGELAVEYRVVLPGGATRWMSARGRMVLDEPGRRARLVGAAFDSTAVREGRDQVARVLETMSDAFFSLDRDWRFTYVNAQAEHLLGRGRDELLGANLWVEFPSAVGDTAFDREYHRAMETGRAGSFEEYYPPPLDKWFEVRVWPTPDGLSVYFHDVTSRRQAEEQRERAYAEASAAQTRLSLLAEMTRVLVSTLDVDEAMSRLVRLVVPRLADWSSVTLVDEAGRLRHSVARHRDPERAADVERFAHLHVEVATEASNSIRVARTGEPVLVPRVDFERTAQGWSGDELSGVLRRLGLESLMVVPLTGRERTLGVLVLAGGPDREPFTDEDFATAVEVGQRAGLAVDNAQLYGEQRDAAEVLQRSLLTELPEPDHLEVVSRYRAAGQQAQVGGDFFWAALQPDGATVIAIGDVMGHDIGATAAMGQVQNLMRGIAYDSQDTPAGVLGRVDRAMAGLQVDTMATSVLGRIEQSEADQASGRRRLRWSNAGHPPPVVLRADGSIEILDRPSDLLLGIAPESERADHCLELEGGDTLLLYTDGLVERRDSPLDHGLARLRQALTALSDRPLQQLCDEVLARLLPDQPEDDVALIAVRSHPEDRPRPADAGSNRLPPERP